MMTWMTRTKFQSGFYQTILISIEVSYQNFPFYRNELLDQERRDRELALRLAEEDSTQVEEVQAPAAK